MAVTMNCLVKARAMVKYNHEKTKATARIKANSTMVLVLSEKWFAALYIPPPLYPLLEE